MNKQPQQKDIFYDNKDCLVEVVDSNANFIFYRYPKNDGMTTMLFARTYEEFFRVFNKNQ